MVRSGQPGVACPGGEPAVLRPAEQVLLLRAALVNLVAVLVVFGRGRGVSQPATASSFGLSARQGDRDEAAARATTRSLRDIRDPLHPRVIVSDPGTRPRPVIRSSNSSMPGRTAGSFWWPPAIPPRRTCPTCSIPTTRQGTCPGSQGSPSNSSSPWLISRSCDRRSSTSTPCSCWKTWRTISPCLQPTCRRSWQAWGAVPGGRPPVLPLPRVGLGTPDRGGPARRPA